MFANHKRIKKTYWAFVIGQPRPPSGMSKVALLKEKVEGKEKVFVKERMEGDSKMSITRYETLDGASEVRFLLILNW
jgi:23S rRNA-/tRNA-specific pseudouridylate synthase